MNVRNYNIIEGTIPVLISAPHVFAHRRPSMRGVMKQGEQFTDTLAKEIAEKTGAWAIYLTEPSVEYDPNYNKIERNLYKSEIANLVKEKKISAVIDIHGLSDYHDYDIGVYYGMRFRKSHNLVLNLIKNISSERELKDLSFHVGYMAKNLQETITEYVNEKLRLPAVQIEIAWYIRKDPILMSKIADGICKVVKEL